MKIGKIFAIAIAIAVGFAVAVPALLPPVAAMNFSGSLMG